MKNSSADSSWMPVDGGNPAASWECTDPALCVDLDGTLVRTDTVLESFLLLLRRAPWRLLLVPLWIFRGKAFLKRMLTKFTTLRVESLPYNEDFLDFLRAESKGGRHLVLASGTDQSIARRIAEHLQLFDAVLASDGEHNLVGPKKTGAIRALLGPRPFIYAGNSRDDFDVWMNADGAILVNAPRRYAKVLQRRGKNVLQEFPTRRSVRSLASAMRLHQWSKNLLIFVPLVLSHKIFHSGELFRAVIGFLSFSFAASTLYIVNDLLDLEADRNHPRKRQRPFARSALSIRTGLLLAAILGSASAILSVRLAVDAALMLAAYCLTSLLYSLFLKQYLFIDVVLLASFFTLRLMYGGAATGVEISIWTLAFSMFLFLSLALMKRLTELRLTLTADQSAVGRRGYLVADLPLISALSAASGYLSVLVLALYLQSPEVHALYSRPLVLWLVCPLLIYWLSRFAILANRGYIHDDPIVFAFTDRASLVVAVLTACVLWFAL